MHVLADPYTDFLKGLQQQHEWCLLDADVTDQPAMSALQALSANQFHGVFCTFLVFLKLVDDAMTARLSGTTDDPFCECPVCALGPNGR